MTVINPNEQPQVWATLITSSNYLPGVLTLNYSLKKCKSQYPLIALYTDKLDEASLQRLHEDNIPTLEIESLLPAATPNLLLDKRFMDTWSKLSFFRLTQFQRIVQLDSDMLVLQNIDELMSLPLGGNKFASTHACVCNPLRFSHYPETWNAASCVFTQDKPHDTRILGPHSSEGLSKCNSGILIVEPSLDLFDQIMCKLEDAKATKAYIFPDQDLLADVFYKNWLSISYVYNCLKTFKSCHPQLWDLSKIKNLHFILSPKPWDVDRSYKDDSGTFELWWKANEERLGASHNL